MRLWIETMFKFACEHLSRLYELNDKSHSQILQKQNAKDRDDALGSGVADGSKTLSHRHSKTAALSNTHFTMNKCY